MDLFYNSLNPSYARFVGLESHMGIQRRREAWETWLARGAVDLIHELADESAYLVGVSAGFKTSGKESLEENENYISVSSGN